MDYPEAHVEKARSFLENLLSKRLTPTAHKWLLEKLNLLETQFNKRTLYLTFATIPRFLDDQTLQLDPTEVAEAANIRDSWRVDHWTTVHTARVLCLLSITGNAQQHLEVLETLFSTAEVNEQVALYQGLSIFPYPQQLQMRAAEGIRTNMTVVFDAIALDNPFVRDYLPQEAWNQMVLKSLFMGRPLFRVMGIDDRGNDALSLMISDYAHERWAAGRTTSPEMWRPIKDFANIEERDDLKRLMESDDPMQRAAALLCQIPPQSTPEEAMIAKLKLDGHRELLNWDQLGMHYFRLQELSSN